MILTACPEVYLTAEERASDLGFGDFGTWVLSLALKAEHVSL